MAAPSLLQPEQWAEIEKAVGLGVTYADLGARFGIPPNVIRQRAYDEDWVTPAKIEKKLAEIQTNQMGKGGNLTDSYKAPSAMKIVAESLLENGQKSSLIASNLALALLGNADASSLAPLRDVSDVKTALSVARTAAGMDKEGSQLNVAFSLFGQDGQGTEDASPIWEADVGENPTSLGNGEET